MPILAENSVHIPRLPLVVLKLLDWIINTERDGFVLVSIPVDAYLRRTAEKTSKRYQQAHTLPDQVFELVYLNDNDRYCQFESEKATLGCLMGHHGSALENFHSILRFGLCESFGRSSSLFGDGIYLSQDREVAHSFLKPSNHGLPGLKHIGDRIGLLTSSEVLLHPREVRHAGSAVSAPSSLLEEPQKQLPTGYIVANSAHCVLNRFLLVSTEVQVSPSGPTQRGCLPSKLVVQWLLIVFYVLILVAVWYFKGKTSNLKWLRKTLSFNFAGR